MRETGRVTASEITQGARSRDGGRGRSHVVEARKRGESGVDPEPSCPAQSSPPASRGLQAAFGGHPRHRDVRDPPPPQQRVEPPARGEGVQAVLPLHHHIPRPRGQRAHDGAAPSPRHKGARGLDAREGAAELGRAGGWQLGVAGGKGERGVDDQDAREAGGLDQGGRVGHGTGGSQ